MIPQNGENMLKIYLLNMIRKKINIGWKLKMNKRVEYAKFDDLRKIKVGEEETEIKGVKNYQLKSLYAPV